LCSNPSSESETNRMANKKEQEQEVESEKKSHSFSVELRSRNSIKNASMEGSGRHDGVLIEGTLGELKSATFQEGGLVLEIVGAEGILRVDLTRDELMIVTRPSYQENEIEVK